MSTCPKCGEQLAPSSGYCAKCAQIPESISHTRDTRLVAWLGGFLAIICFLSVLLLFLDPFQGNREAKKMREDRAWIWEAMRRLEQMPPPGEHRAVGSATAPWSWVTPDHLVFSNGWANYLIRSEPQTNNTDHIALLRFSNGDFYLSSRNFRGGITELMLPTNGDTSRPSDPKDFLNHCGRWQEWNPISLDGRVRCAVLCDPGKINSPKKHLWVWIGTVDAQKETKLFEHRYTVLGGYVAWHTQWHSPDELSLDLYDFGGEAPLTLFTAAESLLRTNPITTLVFSRDLQTGKFTERAQSRGPH